MKKFLKKGLLKATVAGLLVSACMITASADTATSVVTGPSLKLNTWVNSATHSLTPGGGIPQGSKSYVFYSSYGLIPSTFAYDSSRELEIVLMEDDFVGGDDTVKYYNGKFSGRTVSSIYVSGSTVTNGNLDGDNTAEMYLTSKLYRTTNKSLRDPANGTAAGRMFNYQIGINS